jgi:TRAP-type C4-dicarboxylate transport system permease small subunit
MSHFGIDLLVEKLSERTRHRLDFIVPITIGVIALTLIIEGFNLLKLTQYQLYTTMAISHAWATAAMPISGFLMMIYLIEHGINLWKKDEGGRRG